ncbi:amidohydrolase [Candidatus Bathyarchaeota archaeon]|nr:amidohydrolase [Candidatus Bathyarchaeota archaeon]
MITLDKKALKEKVLAEIDARADEIIEYATAIWKYPELGFKEFKTAKLTESKYEEMNWKYKKEIAITGSKAYLKGDGSRPAVAIVGELDALHIPAHPEAHPETGNVHGCCHHSQLAAMLGAGFGLEIVKEYLDGEIVMIAVPAEEYIEIDYRNRLREEGKLEFFGGKQEFIRLGAMDDIDISICSHGTQDQDELVGMMGSSNGFIGKLVHYIGKESHAGGAPDKGINALNAAMVGLMGIHANRETFKDEDTIRVHPIITKGGEIVNNVPADVRMESYVRGRTVEAIKDANTKVNNALRAGAMAVGAEVNILDHPGYMPFKSDDNLDNVLIETAKELYGEKEIKLGEHGTGSSDMGDYSCIMPTSGVSMIGTEGSLHSVDLKIVDPVKQYIVPAKVIALSVIDLLYDDAKKAKEIMAEFKPVTQSEKYAEFMQDLVK